MVYYPKISVLIWDYFVIIFQKNPSETQTRDYKEKHKLDSKLISDSACGAHLSFSQT